MLRQIARYSLLLVFAALLPTGSVQAANLCAQALNVSRAPSGIVQYGSLQLSRPIPAKQDLRIGFYFGTFDPMHEGHVNVILHGIEFAHLDMVVVVPNFITSHKPNATPRGHRLEMVRRRAESLPKVSVMLDDGGLSEVAGKTGPVLDLIRQLRPRESTVLIGDDSFEDLTQHQDITHAGIDHFVVYARSDAPVPVPPVAYPRIEVTSLSGTDQGLSSTVLRKLFAAGQRPTPAQLHPSILEYIEEQGLYQAH